MEDLEEKDKKKKYESDELGTIEAAKRIGISLERMYYWEKKGILQPSFKKFGIREFRRYSRLDIQNAILIKDLVDKENYTLKGAIEIIERLKEKKS